MDRTRNKREMTTHFRSTHTTYYAGNHFQMEISETTLAVIMKIERHSK